MIKRKTDYVYTTTDGREHTDRNIAKKEQQKINFRKNWRSPDNAILQYCRPYGFAIRGLGEETVYCTLRSIENWVLSNKEAILDIIVKSDKVEIQDEIK